MVGQVPIKNGFVLAARNASVSPLDFSSRKTTRFRGSSSGGGAKEETSGEDESVSTGSDERGAYWGSGEDG